MDRGTEGWTENRQMDGKSDRQTDKQTCMETDRGTKVWMNR